MRKFMIAIIGLYLTACVPQETAILSESKPVSESGWRIDQPVRFETNIEDTAQLYDVFITVRHNTDYQWMNLFLFLKTYYPDLTYSRDTLECFLSNETGRWFGQGGSSVKYHKMLYQRQVKFPQEGRYLFEFTQGMRTDAVQNVMDVGMIIVPSAIN